MLGNSYIRVGNTQPGGVMAQGVLFTSASDDTLGDTNGDGTSTSAAPGQWRTLFFDAEATDAQSILNNCYIRYGGVTSNCAVRVTDSAPSLLNTRIQRNTGSGVLVAGSAEPTIQSCQVRENTGLGLELAGAGITAANIQNNQLARNGTYEASAFPPALAALVPQNTFELSGDHRYDAILVHGTTLTSNVAIPPAPPGLAYFVAPNERITVKGPSNPLFTVAPGVIMKFQGTGGITIGGTVSTEQAKIVARRVLFTSAFHDTAGDATGDWSGVTPGVWLDSGGTPPSGGDWSGLQFMTFVDSTSSVDSSAVEYADIGLDLTGHLSSVQRTLFMRNTTGVQSGAAAVHTGFVECDIVANDSTGLKATANANPSITQSNIAENGRFGVWNASAGITLQAPGNWWGSPTGPNPPGSGDAVQGNVNTSTVLAAPRPPLPGNDRTMVTLAVAWTASPVVTTCDLVDGSNHHWYEPTFSEDGWTTVALPNNWSGASNDRYFRGSFNWTGLQVRLAYQANDGLEIYCNGMLIARAGYSCHTSRCVNGPPGCTGTPQHQVFCSRHICRPGSIELPFTSRTALRERRSVGGSIFRARLRWS
jgi:hypothetical protein